MSGLLVISEDEILNAGIKSAKIAIRNQKVY